MSEHDNPAQEPLGRRACLKAKRIQKQAACSARGTEPMKRQRRRWGNPKQPKPKAKQQSLSGHLHVEVTISELGHEPVFDKRVFKL